MKPIIILPPKAMSDEDIKLLRDNDLCVVVAENPAAVKFVDPIPAMSSRTQIESAAIALSRILINGQWGHYTNTTYVGRSEIARIYTDLLIEGTALDKNPQPTPGEREQEYFSQEKLTELRKLAQEEARAERAAAKAARKKEGAKP